MIAEFSVHPMDSVHLSKDLAHLAELLDRTGLTYRMGPMGTCIEGEWVPVMDAVRRCHQAMAAAHPRVLTTILIDDRREHPHHLDDIVKSVDAHYSSRVPRADLEPEC
jgi:uncharacterized protein (TIGR00106 family)